jgi:hypothetical protein
MSQLGTTLTSWDKEIRLTEKKASQILRISQGMSNDDDSLDDPFIFALSEDFKCALCERTGHENTHFHKFITHVMGDALMKAHPRETARIIREHKQFVTIGPRGTPRNNGERTGRRPPSAIRMVAAANNDPPDDGLSENDVDAGTDAHGVSSFETTVQITCIGFDHIQSVGSVENDGTLDYYSVARIAACQDVSLGVRYDEQLIDRINANWDEELASTQDPSTWATITPSTELVYEEHEWEHDPNGFYDDHKDPQGKDMPTTDQS